MALFDDIGKKLTQTGQDAVKKTKELAEIAKLNSQIDAEEKEINNSFIQIGKKYFALFENNADPEFADLFAGIKTSYGKIEGLREQISAVKGADAPRSEGNVGSGKRFCNNCGSELTPTAAFCPECGQKS